MSESSAVPVAESTPVDFAEAFSDNESTVYEPVAAVPATLDESSIHDPPAAAEGNDSFLCCDVSATPGLHHQGQT